MGVGGKTANELFQRCQIYFGDLENSLLQFFFLFSREELMENERYMFLCIYFAWCTDFSGKMWAHYWVALNWLRLKKKIKYKYPFNFLYDTEILNVILSGKL